jgi:peptidyl-prolyl cis-trans isomerase A (cyclophilin A)
MSLPTPRCTWPAAALATAVALLAGCGGGSLESSVPTVSSVSTSTNGTDGVGNYGKKLLITVNGAALDRGITVLSNGCTGVTRLTDGATTSSASTAYYECTVSGDGTLTAVVLRDSSGISLGQATFTVAAPQVTMTISNGTTTLGDVVMTLSPSKTPITVANFLKYVNDGFYNGTVFHRYSPNFVFQGGGYASGLNPANPVPDLKPTNPAITLEDNAGVSNLTWTVAMARTGVPDSATSQFFINLADNTFLDRNLFTGARGYAVFGSVTAGTEVVNAMKTQPCVTYDALLPTGDCLPLPNLVVTSARQTR